MVGVGVKVGRGVRVGVDWLIVLSRLATSPVLDVAVRVGCRVVILIGGVAASLLLEVGVRLSI